MKRTQLAVIPERIGSPTLLFEKFHGYDAFEGGQAFKSQMGGDWLKIVGDAVQPGSRYAEWHARFAAAAEDSDAVVILRASTAWRLVIGWAGNPAFETGLTLHRLLGFPYLPGSAIKGAVHAVAEHELADESNALPVFDRRYLESGPPAALTDAINRAAVVRASFGSLHLRRPDGSDLQETALERFESWLKGLGAVTERSDAWEDTFSLLRTLCGENTGGAVSFLDGVPSPGSVSTGSPLQVDVLSPHYSEYYRDLASANPRVAPSDTQKVNPVQFLCVRPGVEFEFRVRWRLPVDSSVFTALGTFSREQLPAKVESWLIRAVTERGVGAKTAAGYGYLTVSHAALDARPSRNPIPEPAPAAYAVDFLRQDLTIDKLAPLVDKARSNLTLPQQIAVAERLRKLYPQFIAAWRKSTKQVAADRLEWLNKMADAASKGETDK